ncbi:anaphase-promoting complex subunit 1 isoform X2 [Danaus plexippus]|uniref:anaphase-promoting complex subunit 1 isoform X2 n=1 Tax=Danaus plexippus TaxID=13037 RepID=UPI002AB16B35|nr:anaphase-promoting complex subunit 1 isoform X2 [Danaus plexippus]
MIAASEPLFVPHGRTVLTKHPSKIYSKGHNVSSEQSLVYKLSNFAIKEESLVEDEEWWCIREVYYRVEEEKDYLEELQKEQKNEYMDSFRPPSRLKNDFNISIKSELLSGLRKDDVTSAGPSRGSSANSSSNMSKKFNLTSSQNKVPRSRPLNPKTDCYYEEELYVKGRTAVWSKGLISTPATKLSGPEHRETIACYTIDNPIKHATFANFHVEINNTMLIDALNSQIGDVKKNIKIEDTTEHIESKVMPSILLIDNKCMRVYATDGREYIASIPFQVKKVWPMKYGVLLEKDATPILHNSMLATSLLKLNESHNSTFSKSRTFPLNMSARLRAESISGYDQEYPLPTCFSLSHPLDEVTPILMKSPAQGLQYYNDGDIQIIFVSTTPSIILLYDWKLQTHSLWKIRKAVREECLAMCPNMNSSTVFSQSCDFVSSPMHSLRNTTSWTTGSPYHSKKMPATPTRSRQNSPMAKIFHQQGLSPHTSIGQASSTSMTANTMAQTLPSLPLYPDICLDHIWTDSQVIKRDPVESPNDIKAFLHTDLVGHDYLCFMVKMSGVTRLQIVRLKKSRSHGQAFKTNIIVGSISSVLAKDAVVLDHLKMIALIDETGNIILQSGNNFVGKVHVGGILARLIDSPYTKRTHVGRASLPSPFPRRSSLLPSREPPSFDDSALHLLSPVPHSSTSRCERDIGVRSLCDAVGARMSVRSEAGQLYRIALPQPASSPRVAACCSALTAALPEDITMQVIIRWYGVRNAPGTQDLTPEQEWMMFSNLILSLIGYDVEKLTQSKHSEEEQVEVVTKKQRTSSDGSQDDWEYMLNSKMHKTIGNSLANMLNLNKLQAETRQCRTKRKEPFECEKTSQFNTNGLLFPYTLQVFYAFHLVYEDIKLNTLLSSDLKPLSAFLYQIAKDLCLDRYVNHYWLDFPMDYNYEYDDNESQITEAVLKKLTQLNYFTIEPPNVFGYINSMLKDLDVGYYPYMSDVNNMSRDVIEIISTSGLASGVIRTVGSRDTVSASSTPRARTPAPRPHSQAVLLAVDRGITPRHMDNLPPAVSLLLQSIFSNCRSDPPGCSAAYNLVMREDLELQTRVGEAIRDRDEYMESLALEVLEKETAYTQLPHTHEEPALKGEDDAHTGMEHLNTKLLSLLYPKDHRMTEVFNILQSSIPVNINLTQRPEISDHDFIEEQEKYLYAISTRTTSLPVARGMVTLRSLPCSPTEPLSAARLCVTGRGPPPRRAAITISGGDSPPHCLLWPSFHNGVAAGLALVPLTGTTIRSTWILFNKPRGAQDLTTEHAGFLLALGLNGHLKDMPFMNMYEYLVKCHEMISIGLLLGLAATYRGTMDVQATKMMSIHLEPLLPATSVELDIQQGILVAALLGVGLLYQGTAHAHYARVLLAEIGKPPGPEMENCVEREGYALAAGLALGMVCLRAAPAVHLAHLAPALRTYMLGGERSQGTQKEKYKNSSFAVREGAVNLDVTSPGATVALGLLYLRSGSTAVADLLSPPHTAYMLDYVRPDLLMLRVIARGLVLWDDIEPTEEWVENQVAESIRKYCFVKPVEENVDYEAMNQAYCNIIAGACFALGLRFAGTGDEEARDVTLCFADRLLRLGGKPLADLVGPSTLEACTCVCLLAAGMIMCGRGDLSVLRVCRRLRVRVPAARVANTVAPLTHGAQMAVHMCVGLLFLGGCRVSLSRSPEATAALIAAFFPKFPTHSEDNRYHLQAFRHLYVLAVEPRLILPRDLDTGKLCYAHIQVIDLQGAVKEMKAPCIIPELDSLREVRIKDPRYWPITFHRDHNWDQLKTFLQYTWCIDIKQRAGRLSYLDDPDGFLSILAQTLTMDSSPWLHDHIQLFTADERVRNFVKHYLYKDVVNEVCGDCLFQKKRNEALPKKCVCRQYSDEEKEFMAGLSMVAHECVIKDLMCALPVWTTFLKIIKIMKTEPSAYNMWQIKILLSQIENHNKRTTSQMTVDDLEHNEPLISTEFTMAIKQKVLSILDKWEPKITPYLRKYLGLPSSRKWTCDDDTKRALTSYLVYYSLPRNVLRDVTDTTLCDTTLSSEGVSAVRSLIS